MISLREREREREKYLLGERTLSLSWASASLPRRGIQGAIRVENDLRACDYFRFEIRILMFVSRINPRHRDNSRGNSQTHRQNARGEPF